MGIGNQPSNQIDQEIGWTPMAGVLGLRNVFKLVKDGFHNGALAQEELFQPRQGARLHIFTQLGEVPGLSGTC